MKHSGNRGENCTSISHPASSALEVLLADRNPPPYLPLGFPPQKTDGIIETTGTEHCMKVSARAFLLCWSLTGHSRAASGPHTIDRKSVKSKSKSTLKSDHQKTSCLSSCLERSCTFRHSASCSVSQPPDLFNHQICQVRFPWHSFLKLSQYG